MNKPDTSLAPDTNSKVPASPTDGPWYCVIDKLSDTASLFSFTDHRGGKSIRLMKD